MEWNNDRIIGDFFPSFQKYEHRQPETSIRSCTLYAVCIIGIVILSVIIRSTGSEDHFWKRFRADLGDVCSTFVHLWPVHGWYWTNSDHTNGSAQHDIRGQSFGLVSLPLLNRPSRTSEWDLERFRTTSGRVGVRVSSFGRAITEVTTAIAGSSGGVPNAVNLCEI